MDDFRDSNLRPFSYEFVRQMHIQRTMLITPTCGASGASLRSASVVSRARVSGSRGRWLPGSVCNGTYVRSRSLTIGR